MPAAWAVYDDVDTVDCCAGQLLANSSDKGAHQPPSPVVMLLLLSISCALHSWLDVCRSYFTPK